MLCALNLQCIFLYYNTNAAASTTKKREFVPIEIMLIKPFSLEKSYMLFIYEIIFEKK